MDEKNTEKKPQNCLWYDKCKCVKICEHYTPLEEEDISDEELEERKIEYRSAFFEYAEENELYDN